jgi:hypothetical protein
MLPLVDHLVYAAPDLEAGIDLIEQKLGTRAIPGGRHPAWGTRNALLSLGETAYLEIIAPDLELPAPDRARPFNIDTLSTPRLVTWAAKGTDLEQIAQSAGKQGLDLGEVSAGSRLQSDGKVLTWRLTDPFMPRMHGIVPFFIDWGREPHPAASLPKACTLVALYLQHPMAEWIQNIFATLSLDVSVATAPEPGLVAAIQAPHGSVLLHSTING